MEKPFKQVNNEKKPAKVIDDTGNQTNEQDSSTGTDGLSGYDYLNNPTDDNDPHIMTNDEKSKAIKAGMNKGFLGK